MYERSYTFITLYICIHFVKSDYFNVTNRHSDFTLLKSFLDIVIKQLLCQTAVSTYGVCSTNTSQLRVDLTILSSVDWSVQYVIGSELTVLFSCVSSKRTLWRRMHVRRICGQIYTSVD